MVREFHTYALALCAVATTCTVQPYPAKPIRIINTTTAGGPAELTARLVGQKFTDAWGQQVVVDSHTGAGGQTRAVNRVPACGM